MGQGKALKRVFLHAAINGGIAGCATGLALGWSGESLAAVHLQLCLDKGTPSLLNSRHTYGNMICIGRHASVVTCALVLLPGGPAAALQNAAMLGLFSYVVDYMQLQSAEAASRHSARMPGRKVVPSSIAQNACHEPFTQEKHLAGLYSVLEALGACGECYNHEQIACVS